MWLYDLQVTANVSPTIPGRVALSSSLSLTQFSESHTVSRCIKVWCLWKSKRGRGCWKGDKWNICQDCLRPVSRPVYVNKSMMCPEVTSSSVSLNPRRCWGFKVIGQLSGSTGRVFIRSHSASAQSQISAGMLKRERPCSRVQQEHFEIKLPLVYYSVLFCDFGKKPAKTFCPAHQDAGSLEMLFSSEHVFQSCKTTHKRLGVPVFEQEDCTGVSRKC